MKNNIILASLMLLCINCNLKASSIDSTIIAKQEAELKQALSGIDKRIDDRNTAWYQAQQKKQKYDTLGLGQYQLEYKALKAERRRQEIIFVEAHPDYLSSITALKDIIGHFPDDIMRYEALYYKLNKDVQNSDKGKKLKSIINNFKRIAIGSKALDFICKDTLNTDVKLKDFKGKFLLIDFWASWCSYCRQESPYLVKAYKRFHSKNFSILSVSLDQADKRQAWIDAIHKDKLLWTNVSDLKGWDSDVAKLYCIQSIPQNFLIDPKGKIIAFNLRGEKLLSTLEEILNKK